MPRHIYAGRAGVNIFDKSIIRVGLVLAFALLSSLVLDTSDAKAECTCGSGVVPCGVVCCSATTYCESGQICADGGCLDRNSARVCSDNRYCEQGDVCTPDSRCISASSERYCGGRSFCQAGSACIGGGKCLSVTSERYCGNGKYCSEGSYCSGGGCRSHAADEADRRFREAQEAVRRIEEAALAQQRRDAEARAEREAAAQRARNSSSGNSGDCSTITGPGMGPTGPCDVPKPGRAAPASPPPAVRPPARPPSRVVLAPPASCNSCAAIDAVAEILPQFGQVLELAGQELNSPNIAPPQQWITRPPPQASIRPDPIAQQPDDSASDASRDKPVSLRLPSLSLDHPFKIEDELEKDYAQRCKEAFGELMSGKDNPVETAKKKIRELKKQGNSIIDTVQHPFDSAKAWLQAKIDEKIPKVEWKTYFKILKEQIRKSETKDKQEELKRFEEKWGDKCVKEAYTKDIEKELKQVAAEAPDAGDAQ